MKHHTKDKGDLAVAKVICDLTEKGYIVFVPAITEHLPFDIIAYEENTGKSFRIQCKYCSDGVVKNSTSWTSKTGNHKHYYNSDDFDYYALFIPDKNIILYPSIKYKGILIRFSIPEKSYEFWWYEDFLNFTDQAFKKRCWDFGISIIPKNELITHLKQYRSINAVSKYLQKNEKTVRKWFEYYNLLVPTERIELPC